MAISQGATAAAQLLYPQLHAYIYLYMYIDMHIYIYIYIYI